MSESDSACPAPVCPKNTECRIFSAPVTGNCQARGECRTQFECLATDLPASQSCGNGRHCDGAGACLVASKARLGEGCSTAADCAEGECVARSAGKICCDAACDGVCQACSAAGRCDQAPPDDGSCPVVQCPAGDACTSYPATLSRDRCLAFGVCASAANHCAATFSSAGTACGSGLQCDGAGKCDSVCAVGQAWCEGACIDPLTNPKFCGASGACSGSAAGSSCTAAETCMGGKCRGWNSSKSIVSGRDGIVQATVAASPNGDGVVLWQEEGADGLDRPDLWVRVYDPLSADWSAAARIKQGGTNPRELGLFPAGDGTFVVIWAEDDAIRSRRWDGNSWAAPSTVDNVAPYTGFTLGHDGVSRGIVAWSEYDDATGDYLVRTRIWNPVSHIWNPRSIVQTSARRVNGFSPAIGTNGVAFMMWTRAPPQVPNDYWEDWGARFNPVTGTWEAANQVGESQVRASGEYLAVTEGGSALAIWAGRMKGLVWDAKTSKWATISRDGDYIDAALCSVGGEDALLAGRTAGLNTWAQRWDGNSRSLDPRVVLTSDDQGAILRCAPGFAFAAWSDGVRRWDGAKNEWGAATTLAPGGALSDLTVARNGTALLLRRVARDPGSGRYTGLEVRHFE